MTTRITIFSDLHGNLAAGQAVLAGVDAEAPDATYCLGDLVGYGALPNKTSALVGARGIPTIMGNYDDGVGSTATTAAAPTRTPTRRPAVNSR